MHRFKFILRAFFESVKVTVESFILPTGNYLIPSLLVSLAILVVVIISTILGLPRLLDIPGTLLGCVLLGGILFIERSERSEVSNFYRAAKTRVQSVVGRKEGPAPDTTAEVVGSNSSDSSEGSTDRPKSGGPDNNSAIDDWCSSGNSEPVETASQEPDDKGSFTE